MADPCTCKTRTFLLMPKALRVAIFRKNSHFFLKKLMDLFFRSYNDSKLRGFAVFKTEKKERLTYL